MPSPRHPLYEPATIYSALRRAVVERVAAYGIFAEPPGIPVLDSGDTDLRTRADNALTQRVGADGGGGGLCVGVGLVSIRPGDRGPLHRVVTLSVQVHENPAINWSDNGRNLAAEDLAALLELPLGWTEGDGDAAEGWCPAGIWTRLVFAGLTPVLQTPSLNVWDTRWTTETLLQLTES